ncbi:MAG: polysaccharide biosynthesis/export family protein, partial [Candidatus Binatia bacterium]
MILLLAASSACARLASREAASEGPATDPARLQEFLASRRDPGVVKDPKIGPGDVIHVDVVGEAEPSREYTVSRKGAIRL